MTLCAGATIGSPGSDPMSAMIGSNVAPKASNDSWDSWDSWDSQTSDTWISPSDSTAQW